MKFLRADQPLDAHGDAVGAPWLGLRAAAEGLGRTGGDPKALASRLGVPFHLAVLAKHHAAAGRDPEDELASIPFYSLCRGLLLPVSGMLPDRAAQLFGVVVPQPPAPAEREALVARFLGAEVGLDVHQKLAFLVGDPYRGGRGRFKRESLLRLLRKNALVTRREQLDRLALTGDVAILAAESRGECVRGEPALTAAEVLDTLEVFGAAKRNDQFRLLESLLLRCGRLEAYLLVKLVLRATGLRYESEMLARALGAHFAVEPEQVVHAMALSDVFRVVALLDAEGQEGLRSIQLQPLVPVRPALAGGSAEKLDRYPVWVERKYDGVRLMLHKTTDRLGSVLCGAYTRNRRDYLELVPSLDATIKLLPAQSLIVDGELYGTVLRADGLRPATVYEVFGSLQGESSVPVQLRYAAFDLLYRDGHDLTGQPLSARRQQLTALVAPMTGVPSSIPVTVAEGQMAQGGEDVKRLYQHFRAQGYEGIIAKDLDSLYRLASRDPSWRKRKPEITLDLVLLGAVLAVNTKEKSGMFGSYVIGARSPDGGYEDVGDVAGVDQVRDREIQHLIMRDGLLNGRRIERKTISGTGTGFELVPQIVVTVKMSGIVRDPVAGRLRLRDPKLAMIRADKPAPEADTLKKIEALHLRQQVG